MKTIDRKRLCLTEVGRKRGIEMLDVAYLTRRAEQELALAQRSQVPAAVTAHYKLASMYLERVEALKRSKP